MGVTAMNDDLSRLVTNFFKNDYRERGKVKWNGYFLSDHTSSLKQEKQQRHHVTKKNGTNVLIRNEVTLTVCQ
jgi:hypothetical protein